MLFLKLDALCYWEDIMHDIKETNQQIQKLIDGVIAGEESAILSLLDKYEPLLLKEAAKLSEICEELSKDEAYLLLAERLILSIHKFKGIPKM